MNFIFIYLIYLLSLAEALTVSCIQMIYTRYTIYCSKLPYEKQYT